MQLRTLFSNLIRDKSLNQNLKTFIDQVNAVNGQVSPWVASHLVSWCGSLDLQIFDEFGQNEKKALSIEFVGVLVNSKLGVGAQRLDRDRHHRPTDLMRKVTIYDLHMII